MNNSTGKVLCNRGTGDWVASGCGVGSGIGLTLEDDPSEEGEADPFGMRFFDVDNDRRIDVLYTIRRGSTQIRRNTGAGFEVLAASPLDLVFDEDNALLADLNGDGLLDPATIGSNGQVSYHLNLGYGRWSESLDMGAPPVSTGEAGELVLEDVNRDGLDDRVLIAGSKVTYWLNRNGTYFDDAVTLQASDVEGGLPTRSAFTTVLFADMNANGSRDVVWLEPTGKAIYLELFPTPPNLLSRIENGLGSVQEIHYGTAVGQRQLATDPWPYSLPLPMNVVERTDSWVTLTGGENGAGLHEQTLYRYRNGYYDGIEKQFRGFAWVEATVPPDSSGRDTQESGRAETAFDLGVDDAYRHGRMLRQRTFSDDRPLSEVLLEHKDCTLAGVPTSGLRFPIRHVCQTGTTSILQEGAPPDEWATTYAESSYDGYGNVVSAVSHGVIHRGSPEAPKACQACDRGADVFGAPCGAQCLGDEHYQETELIVPGQATGGRWILGRPHTERSYGRPGLPATESVTYYDGPDFVGLPKGELSRGTARRVTQKVDAGLTATIDVARFAHDQHGNVVAQLDPLGSITDQAEHRRSYSYDANGLRVVRAEIHLQSPEKTPYRLRREAIYDPAFDEVSEVTSWMVVEDHTVRSARNARRYRYDELGRKAAILEPGDPETAPSTTIAWELADPASMVRLRRRSMAGGEQDIESVRCLDGLGREFQERARVNGQSFQVNGFSELNSRGAAVRVYQPYLAERSDCDKAAPRDVLYTDLRYDAAFRERSRTLPDAELYGSASEPRIEYSPLSRSRFDSEDADPKGRHADTPEVEYLDGLGRVVAFERQLDASGAGASTRAEYDSLGRLSTLIDDAGHRKEQRYDLLGRLVALDDPNAGASTFRYDPAGNLVERRDARGVVTRTEYDGANRPQTQWNDSDRTGSELRFRYDFGGSCDMGKCGHAAGRAVEVSYPLPLVLTQLIGGDPRGVDHLGYDARGRPVYEARTLGGHAYETEHVFDNADRPLAIVHPDGRKVATKYDAAGRAVAIEDIIDELRYDARAQASQLTFANGAVERWSYDAVQRLAHASLQTRDSKKRRDVSYEHDRVGNVQRLADAGVAPPGWKALSAKLEYDAWYRPTNTEYLRGEDRELQRFDFDRLDNLTSATSSLGSASGAHVGELTYDPKRPNAVLRAGELQLAYDASGQLVARGESDLTWDHLGRLTTVRRGKVLLASFAYGVGTSRVASVEGGGVTLYVSADFEVRDAVGVHYARIGETRIARRESATLATSLLGDPAPVGSPDGVVSAGDAWIYHARREGLIGGAKAPSADTAGLMLRSAARRLLIEAGDGVAMLHHDHLGSLIAATDLSGKERGRRRYAMVEGEDLTSGYVDRYGFTGQEEVDSVSLVRFQHRWLDPLTRRWTRPDPAFAAVSALGAERGGEMADPYGYVGNNWMNAVDPTGLTGQQIVRHGTRFEGIKSLFGVIKAAITHGSSSAGAAPHTEDRGEYMVTTERSKNPLYGSHNYTFDKRLPNWNVTPEVAKAHLMKNFQTYFPGNTRGRPLTLGASAWLFGSRVKVVSQTPTSFTNQTTFLHLFHGEVRFGFETRADGLHAVFNGSSQGGRNPALNNMLGGPTFNQLLNDLPPPQRVQQ